jgi:hypothetical protein
MPMHNLTEAIAGSPRLSFPKFLSNSSHTSRQPKDRAANYFIHTSSSKTLPAIIAGAIIPEIMRILGIHQRTAEPLIVAIKNFLALSSYIVRDCAQK